VLRGRRSNLAALVAGSAVTLYLVVFGAFLPALETERLSPRLGAAVARHLQPGDRLASCKASEASIGFYLPRAPEVMGDPDSVAAELRSAAGDALVLVPDDERHLLARLQAGDSARWELLETVEGMILPGLSLRRILVMRRHADSIVPPRGDAAPDAQARSMRP
jgi:hypothetical protein